MIKVATGIIGAGQGAGNGTRAQGTLFNGWLNKAKLTLRHLVMSDNDTSNVWDIYIVRQQEKTGIVEQRVKDEFYYHNNRELRKSIPRKTWKRHSAFLVYRQQMEALEMERMTNRS